MEMEITMTKNTTFVRHGDLLIRRVESIPTTAKPTNDAILAYGEVTGHKHRLVGQQVQVFQDEKTQIKYFQLGQQAELVHEEHKPIQLEEGTYMVVQEREFDFFESEIRRVAD